MGAWGCDVLENDHALDTIAVFSDLLAEGYSFDAAIDACFDQRNDGDKHDSIPDYMRLPEGVFGMTALQIGAGRLDPRAVSLTEELLTQELSEDALASWKNPDERRQALLRFRELLSEATKSHRSGQSPRPLHADHSSPIHILFG